MTCSSSRTLPGQGCASKRRHRGGAKPRGAPYGAAREEDARERGDVLAALAQRRQADLDGVEPVEEVLAEPALGRGLAAMSALVAASTRTSTCCARELPTGWNSPVCSTRSSLRLLAERHVRDLVEEQRAAVGELEAADAIGAARR